jgi:DNA repair exonuclease SbcCD ATPase subunit
MRVLNEAKARLREVEEGLAALQSKYEECVSKKEELRQKCELCEARLNRAEKVTDTTSIIKYSWRSNRGGSRVVLAHAWTMTESSNLICPLPWNISNIPPLTKHAQYHSYFKLTEAAQKDRGQLGQ